MKFAIEPFSLSDYPGKLSAVLFLPGCNLRCGYCHNPELVLPNKGGNFVDEEFLKTFLESRQGLLDGIVICGGEPTIHHDLVQLIVLIKSYGFLVKLDTNGTNAHVVQMLIEKNLIDFVALDVKHTLSKYENVSPKVKIDLKSIQKTIQLLKENNVQYELRSTLVPGMHSLQDIHEMGLEILGAQTWALQNFRRGKHIDAHFENRDSFTEDEMQRFEKIAKRYAQNVVVR